MLALELTLTTEAAEKLFGITPALANTPFLGMATLCGLAVVADTPWGRESPSAFAQSIRGNLLIANMQPYSSGWLFVLLLLLALLAYAANSGKIQGVLGKVIHIIEAATVLVAYVLLSATVLRELPPPVPRLAVVQMGVLSVTTAVFLGVTACIALAAMMVVRFAIGLAIWLIPIPLVDIVFETIKKVVTIVLIISYLINPFLATMIAAGLILLSLLTVRWAFRLMMFVARIIVMPRLGFQRTHRHGKSIRLPASALALRGFRRRENAVLAVAGEEIHLFRRAAEVTPSVVLTATATRLVLVRGFWWSEMRELDSNGLVVSRIAFATQAFETLRGAASPSLMTLEQSKLSLWLTPRATSAASS